MPEEIKCKRCGNLRPALGFAPVPTDLGQSIATEVCQQCWADWVKTQTMLINHYGLDLSNPETHEFLFDQMRAFFFHEGRAAGIDTSKQGTVQW